MRSPGSIYVACRYRRASRLVVLWQQFKRVDMARPDDSEVAAVERGDPSHAMAFGDGDHGCVRPAEPQVSVDADQVLDTLPVGDAEVCYFQLAVDDGRVQAGFRLGAELPVDQVGGLGDDHGCGDQRTLVALQQFPASRVVPVGTIGRRDQRAGVHDQHLVAPKSLGQHFIGLCRAAPGGRSAHSSEGQPTPRHSGQLSRQQIRCKLLRGLAAAGRLSRQRLSDGAIQMKRDCHESSVTVHVRKPG